MSARIHVFADEAGNFDFTRNQGASKYYILCTVTLSGGCSIGNELLSLRREMAFQGLSRESCLHATEDDQAVRNRVFDLLAGHDFRIDATILEKSKAQPQVRLNEPTFYKYSWFYHFKYSAPRIVRRDDELLVTAASLGTKKKKAAFHSAIRDVAFQVVPTLKYQTAFWPAASDPCLQIADYCTWAIQRKWESRDLRSYQLIQSKIGSEYDLWAVGLQHYY